MQQIINFLIRNKNFLLFVLLFLISLIFTFQSHSYHRSKFVNSANFLSGGVYSSVSGITDYFKLKTYNRQLLEENARLRERLNNTENTSLFSQVDSTVFASQFTYITAPVIDNTYSKTDNFITLKAGRSDSIKSDMGVITSQGIVGVIDNVSNKYSTVLSILNTSFLTNAKLKNTNHAGTLIWDGKEPNVMLVQDMQQQAPVAVGDTIETSGKSAIFPKGIPIGTIQAFELDDSKNFYTLKVLLFNDMTDLGHVYIIRNKDLVEIQHLQTNELNDE